MTHSHRQFLQLPIPVQQQVLTYLQNNDFKAAKHVYDNALHESEVEPALACGRALALR